MSEEKDKEVCPIQCVLSEDDISSIKMVSGFLTRFRNALGNFMMVVIFVIIIAGIGGVLWLVSAGQINIFKMLGL